MNRKLKVFMLSLVVVLFAVASVFAITKDDFESLVVSDSEITPATMEGYNYRQRIYVDTESLEEKLGPVSWEVYPESDGVREWLVWYPISDDKNIIIEGVLPEYSTSEAEDANSYIIHVIAHVSGDIDTGEVDDEGDPIYISGDISADVDGEGLTIEVEKDETSVDLFPDMVTIDTSAVKDIHKAGNDYSVIINFPRTTAITIAEEEDDDERTITTRTSGDVFVNAALEYNPEDIETFEESLNLPTWLSYDVVATQYQGTYEEDDDGKLVYVEDDSTTFVKTLRIFYDSEAELEEEVPGSVRIIVTPSSTASVTDDRYEEDDPKSESTKPFSELHGDTATIGWNVSFNPISPISLDKTEATLPVKYGSSADLTVNYAVQNVESTPVFTPDISDKVKLTASVTPASGVEPGGFITVRAEPVALADAVYSTDMIVTDTNGLTATMRLNVSVDVPSIVLSENTVNLIAAYGSSPVSSSVGYSGPKPVGWKLSKAISDDFGLRLTSDDSRITISMGTLVSGDWNGTLSILDEYGKSADIALALKCVVSGDPVIVISGDIPDGLIINAGKDAKYTFNAGNTYGNVKWSVVGENLDGLITPLTGEGNVFTFVINALAGKPGKHEATINATDESGRKAASYSFSWTVMPHIAISWDVDTISVDYGSSADIFVLYDYQEPASIVFSPDISADVKLSYDVRPQYISDPTPHGRIVIIAEPVTPLIKLYSTDMIVTDSDGYSDSMTLYISVDMEPIVVTPVSASISVDVSASKDVSFTASNNSGKVSWDLGTVPDGIKVVPASGEYATEYMNVMNYTVTGVTAGTYSVDVTATDEAGRSADVTLYITVNDTEAFTITPSARSVSVAEGKSSDIAVTAENNTGLVNWKLGTVPSGVKVEVATGTAYMTENDTVKVYTVTGVTAGAYSVDVVAEDAAGHTANATLNITVTGSGPNPPVPVTFTITASKTSVSVETGESDTVTFTAKNNSGDVKTWAYEVVSGTASGVTVTNNAGTFTIKGNTAGTYSVKVTATDGAGKPATATISVKVEDKPVEKLAVSPTTASATVSVGGTDNVSFSASGNSGNVTWTLGTIPSGITVAPATGLGYVTEQNTRMVYTVTGVTAGSYSVKVTAADASGAKAEATISITVQGTGPTPDDGHIDSPSFTLDDTEKSAIREALTSKLGSIVANAKVVELPSSAMPDGSTISYLGTNTVYLPVIVVTESGVYVFGVSLENLPVGALLKWTPQVSDAGTGEYIEASAEEENAVFLDDSGEVITKVPSNKHVNIAAYFEPGKNYEPIITANTTDPDIKGVGSSGGGCDAGLGALVSAIAAAFFISRKRS